jgi:hypothetical protein
MPRLLLLLLLLIPWPPLSLPPLLWCYKYILLASCHRRTFAT